MDFFSGGSKIKKSLNSRKSDSFSARGRKLKINSLGYWYDWQNWYKKLDEMLTRETHIEGILQKNSVKNLYWRKLNVFHIKSQGPSKKCRKKTLMAKTKCFSHEITSNQGVPSHKIGVSKKVSEKPLLAKTKCFSHRDFSTLLRTPRFYVMGPPDFMWFYVKNT